MSDEKIKEERKFINVIMKALEEAGEISTDLVMDQNFVEVHHKQKIFKITVERKN